MKATRRSFLQSGLGAAAGLVLPSCSTAPFPRRGERGKGRRPNVLWITSEDTCPDLACYGGQLVETPNLDRLASEGIRFTRAYTTAPVCSPSRSAFMTGMYQTTIGAHNHRSHRRDGYTLPPPVKLITEYFREAGYFTANVRTAAPGVRGTGKTDFNFHVRRPFDGTDWDQRKKGQPFFAHLNLRLTHRPFERDPLRPIDPSRVKVPPAYPDTPLSRRDWADYLESIQVLDREIGKVLDRLREEGLEENTLVFYFGDHGRPQVRAKQWLYEGGIHIPLIVRWPGRLPEGRVSGALVSAVDFAPTSLSMAGIEPPPHMQGKVFLGKAAERREYVFAARDRCDETVDRIRCVLDGRFKYIRNFMPERPYTQFNAYKESFYPDLPLMEVLHSEGKLGPGPERFMAPCKPAEELYDLREDPFELHNLAGLKEGGKPLLRLRAVLARWIEETKDQGRFPEDPRVVQYWKKVARRRFRARMKRWGLSPEGRPEERLAHWRKKLLE